VRAAQSVVDRFDAEVIKMIADRSYHRLLQVGWIQADIDGDGRMELVPATDQAGQEAPVRRYELVTVTATRRSRERHEALLPGREGLRRLGQRPRALQGPGCEQDAVGIPERPDLLLQVVARNP
jgi:hypothetical protein